MGCGGVACGGMKGCFVGIVQGECVRVCGGGGLVHWSA